MGDVCCGDTQAIARVLLKTMDMTLPDAGPVAKKDMTLAVLAAE